MTDRRLCVAKQTLESLQESDIDVVIAVAGYEPRCTHVVRTLCSLWGRTPKEIGRKLMLLSFSDNRELESRRAVDAEFREYEPRWTLDVGKRSGLDVSKELSRALPDNGPGRVLVDYSSMSRFLYLCLLPLAFDRVQLTYVYSIGKYGNAEPNYPTSAIGDILSVPGLEGLPYATRPRVFYFGLGYDGEGALALADKLEANCFVVFWADPGASSSAAKTAEIKNTNLIERSMARFTRDLRDVAGTAALLSQFAFESARSDKVVFVPVGPKPHILACGIAAIQHSHATLLAPHLGAGGIRENFPPIEATGETVCTSISRLPLD